MSLPQYIPAAWAKQRFIPTLCHIMAGSSLVACMMVAQQCLHGKQGWFIMTWFFCHAGIMAVVPGHPVRYHPNRSSPFNPELISIVSLP